MHMTHAGTNQEPTGEADVIPGTSRPGASGVPSSPGRPLRRDAERNRRLILDTAGDLFAEYGMDVGLDQIARRAGIGVGTVYRRFRDRDDLIETLFSERLDQVRTIAEEAARRPDSWEALVWFMEQTVQEQLGDRTLKLLMNDEIKGEDRLAIARDQLTPALERLVQRAQADGGLRPDVTAMDLGILSSAVNSCRTPRQPELWRRYLVVLLDGLRESRASSTPLPRTAPETIPFP